MDKLGYLSTMNNLLPCPFCGKTNTLDMYDNTEDEAFADYPMYRIVCNATRNNGCGGSSGYKDSKVGAIALWQSRK